MRYTTAPGLVVGTQPHTHTSSLRYHRRQARWKRGLAQRRRGPAEPVRVHTGPGKQRLGAGRSLSLPGLTVGDTPIILSKVHIRTWLQSLLLPATVCSFQPKQAGTSPLCSSRACAFRRATREWEQRLNTPMPATATFHGRHCHFRF